ncbi:ABC transporter ATP-binding protein [Rubinisphaera margarita]|uniref:ABC transporter ATP-binding protein n=1 Tax=Rubinisphaera margarita TaxID=2909586 RepID=UPI001EE92452|nr:ABC transporter ATP-binding protein [Rubinisphaera margarita]MCG6154729.1 ABC transporter ATP-binding protein [Rubinisphaera margarita]
MSLKLISIHKSYREPNGEKLPVLDVPEFELKTGEQAALVGSSGGGKTTLLNIISGITTPDSGQVLIDNVEITRLPEAARDRFRAERIGFVYQTFNLLPAFTAFENVLLGMSFARGRADRKHAKDLLEKVGLGHRLTHRPGQLSVGEQQRVSIARALANRPNLMLADEPTASVDPANQNKILDLIQQMCREHNVSLLLVTHAPEIAERFDRVVQLADFNQVLQKT